MKKVYKRIAHLKIFQVYSILIVNFYGMLNFFVEI